jgi:dihydroorotate dehydrogenase
VYGLLFRLVITRLNPEFAHHASVGAFRYAWPFVRVARWLRVFPPPRPTSAVDAMGIHFTAPMGLAAGMDKNAVAVRGLMATGFSFVEIGTVTPKAQPGNPAPRSWRELDLHALRNQMGFNNEGADAVARRLRRLRKTRLGRAAVIGVNIGKNKVTAAEDAAADYGYSARVLAPYADFLVVNVSSPNTPGLRDLQSTAALRPILVSARAGADEAMAGAGMAGAGMAGGAGEARAAAGAAGGATEGGSRVPLLVKIAPDLADADVDAIADLAVELGLDGIVAVNTTIKHDLGPGGLSGPPLRERALEVVARLRARVGPEMCIMGVGGISTVDDARAMLAAGATLLQVYTGFVYGGPAWPARVNRALG